MTQFFRLLFLAVLSVFFLQSKATNFVYEGDQHVKTAISHKSFASEYIYFNTKDPEDITLSWKVITNTIPVSWDVSLCDYGNCYISIPFAAEMNPYTKEKRQGGDKMFFSLSVNPNEDMGTGNLTLYVFDNKDTSRGDTISFEIRSTDWLSVSKVESKPLSIYPNPATDQISINGHTALTQYSLVGVNGRTAQAVFLTQESNRVHIDLSHIKPGYYLLRARDINGQTYQRRLLIY